MGRQERKTQMRKSWIYACIGAVLLIGGNTRAVEILGINEPGTPDYSDWFGRISNVVALDYDVFPKSISIDSSRSEAFVTFELQTLPYAKIVDLNLGMVKTKYMGNFASGQIVDVVENPYSDSRIIFCSKVDSANIYELSRHNNAIIDSYCLCNPICSVYNFQYDDKILIYKSSIISHILKICNLDNMEEYEIDLSMQLNNIANVVIDSNTEYAYIVSDDNPGVVVEVSLSTHSVVRTHYFDSNIVCNNCALINSNDSIFISTYDIMTLKQYIYSICLETFTIEKSVQLNDDESHIEIIGVSDSKLYLGDLDSSPGVIAYNSDLERLSRIDCQTDIIQLNSTELYGNWIVVSDLNEPAKLEIITINPFESKDVLEFNGETKNVTSITRNIANDEYILSSSCKNPPRLFRLDPFTYELVGTVVFDSYSEQAFESVFYEQFLDKLISISTGESEHVLYIDSENYVINIDYEILPKINITEVIIDEDEQSLFLLGNEKVLKYNIAIAEIVDQMGSVHPDSALTTLVKDSNRNQLLIGSSTGQILKCSVDPMQVLDEIELGNEVTAGLCVSSIDSAYFTTSSLIPNPLKINQIELTNFSVTNQETLENDENVAEKLIYDFKNNIINIGIQTLKSKIVLVDPLEMEVIARINDFSIGKNIVDCYQDEQDEKNLWCNGSMGAQVIETRNNQSYAIQGCKVNLTNYAVVRNVNMFCHENEGRIRLGIYDSFLNLVWQSNEMDDLQSNSWNQCIISEGQPDSLVLSPGTYWFLYQSDSTADVPSFITGDFGDGLRQMQAYGLFPQTLHFAQYTSDRWAIYAEYDHLYPTATPTVSPTPTPTGTASPDPTETPAASTATPTGVPTPTPEPTSPPGVNLILNRTHFHPGCMFDLKAEMIPDKSEPVPLHLWIILDVFGAYWYGPAWTQNPVCYDLGILTTSSTEQILQFDWPETQSAAEDICFWGAMTDDSHTRIIGNYDKISFGYGP